MSDPSETSNSPQQQQQQPSNNNNNVDNDTTKNEEETNNTISDNNNDNPPVSSTTTLKQLPPAAFDAKYKIHFKAVGGAPILKKNKFLLKGSSTVWDVISFLRDVALKLPERDPLFLYINQAFSPSLDQTVASLHSCFSVNDELVLHYAIQLSWG
jgi:ubiquitin-like protein ATG12